MQQGALSAFAYEGAFASQPLATNLESLVPFVSRLGGPGCPVAAPGGVLQGRFGWLNPATGYVSNTRTTAQDASGVVIPLRSLNGSNGGVVGGPRGIAGPQASWTWETWDPQYRAYRTRAGIVTTLQGRGNFWLRFPGGALPTQPVYASLVDGSAISGAADNAEPTHFSVCTEAQPGSLAIVSSTLFFTP